MKTGRVAATVVSTLKHPRLAAHRVLLVELDGPDARPSGAYSVAVDAVGAGIGQPVLVLDEGSSARQILEDPEAPIRAVIVGIIDAIDLPQASAPATTTSRRRARRPRSP